MQPHDILVQVRKVQAKETLGQVCDLHAVSSLATPNRSFSYCSNLQLPISVKLCLPRHTGLTPPDLTPLERRGMQDQL